MLSIFYMYTMDIEQLIKHGVSNKDIYEIWSQGPEFVREFWDTNATWPIAFEDVKDDICNGIYNFGDKFLIQLGVSEKDLGYIKEDLKKYRFYEENEEFTKLQETWIKGDKYDGLFNIMYGYFFGMNNNNKEQSFIANVLWSSMIFKKYNTNGFDFSRKLFDYTKNNEYKMETYCSPQSFKFCIGSLGWKTTLFMNNGIMIGCSKRFESHFNNDSIEMKHIVEDISGMFFLIASFNILQSPYNYKNKKNPYHLSETKIIEIIG